MAATNFPFVFQPANLKNISGNIPRFNFKNDGTYSIASAIPAVTGPLCIQGYSSSLGDGGRAIIDGGTNLINIINVGGNNILADLIFQNNGTSGNNDGVVGGNSIIIYIRCVANNIRGSGFNQANVDAVFIECEAYACNTSNTAGAGGFVLNSTFSLFNCIAHDNTGSNNNGFVITTSASGVNLINCISAGNGLHGFVGAHTASLCLVQCDAYNNGGDGCRNTNTTLNSSAMIRNCNFVKNTGWGINSTITTGRYYGTIDNCGFGSGTQANGSGNTNNIDAIVVSGSVTYDSGVTPWVDPANGDFRINFGEAEGAGRGAFTETSASLSAPNTIGYPDIGAAQHADSQKGGTFGG